MLALDGKQTRNVLHAHGLDSPAGIGFVFLDPARNVFYDWHTHDYHQLFYAVDGPTQIETECGRFILPQGRAAWIPVGTRHRTLITDAKGASLFFSPVAVRDEASRVRILVADPLMREMILHATRWDRDAMRADPLAESFLGTLALLCGEWLESELPLFLPSTAHPAIRRAMDYAVVDLGAATQAGAQGAAALSERTFRRLFLQEAGIGWQAWLAQARMLKAMGLLMEGRRVTDVALDVGYGSLSAFAKAFTQITGEAPAQFRRRHLSGAKTAASVILPNTGGARGG